MAENVRELLRLLTYDAEPMVSWEEIYYFKDENGFVPSRQSNNFRTWLLDNFGIGQTSDADGIVQTAQAKHQEEYQAWMKTYCGE